MCIRHQGRTLGFTTAVHKVTINGTFFPPDFFEGCNVNAAFKCSVDRMTVLNFSYTHVCMYVCVCIHSVCMYIRMYVCVCMYV
jgi:hypothetical protein